jgi:hypothetical protein
MKAHDLQIADATRLRTRARDASGARLGHRGERFELRNPNHHGTSGERSENDAAFKAYHRLRRANGPISADDVLALALSVIRGRVFAMTSF